MEANRMEQEKQAEIKKQIAELRARYARLRNICGPQHISKATIEKYTQEISALQTQIC